MNLRDVNIITKKYAGFDLEDYFKSSEYFIYLIDYNKQEINFQDGIKNKELDEKCKEGF